MWFPNVAALLVVAFVIQMMNGSSLIVSTDDVALLEIKSKITDDPQGVLKSWNADLPFCQWQGVTCGRRHRRVTSLKLQEMDLVGTLSPYVGNLSFLRDIILDGNHFHESIPPEVGRLFRLEILSLSNNSFIGEVPSNISSCSKLSILDLSLNKLSGKIPNIFPSLHRFTIFSFGRNNLTGGIPPSIGNLTSLEEVYFPSNPLGGSIPGSFSGLKNLRILGLAEMGLVGAFPSFLFNLSKLEILNLPVNELVGGLPSSLCLSQPHLQRLEIGVNHFSGFYPTSISNCSRLERFDSSENAFTGEIATDFGKLPYLEWLTLGLTRTSQGFGGMINLDNVANCSNLQVLELENVRLRNGLPDWIGNLTKLRYLMFQRNYISGSLPSSIGNLISLSVLSLARNNFSGMIPESISKLTNLGALSLGLNQFSGIIPEYIGNMSSLTILRLDGNNLEGPVPPTIGKCTRLIHLSLAANNLTGRIPKELFQLTSLSIELDLSRNNLSGVLPPEIGFLKNLAALDLYENRLGGELPASLSSCFSLQFLNLSSNFFHGSMPQALASLRGLEDVDLSQNNFSGQIPKYLEEISLKHLDLSNNDFEGEVSVKGVFANTSAISIRGNPKLCGGKTELHLPKCTSSDSRKGRKLSVGVIVAISLSATVAGIALVSFVLFYSFKKKKKEKSSESTLTKSFKKISYGTLSKATEGFSPQNLIGTGSFASVYKGLLHENGLTVAIKVLNLQRKGGSKSFLAECDALRNIRHRNLVKVITSCSSIDFQGNDFKALVYDFMPNGSLERWLNPSTEGIYDMHDDQSHQLDLVQRISIAKDVACALDYLHYGCGKVVIHCDLKPSNILLDADMIAHVGDFGLAKIISREQLSDANRSSSSSLIRGTIGYAPPEYGLGNEISTKGDIYSYGILLLEMVTGKRPVDPMFQEDLSLHSYARSALANGSVLQIVDPMLLNDDAKVKEACLISLVKIGVQCSSEYPQDRMNIGTVIHELTVSTFGA